MIAIIRKNRRILTTIGLVLSLIAGGITILGTNNEISGTLFLLLAILTVIYSVFFYFIKRKKRKEKFKTWVSKEPLYVAIILGIICLLGIIESTPRTPEITTVFVITFIAVVVFSYYNFSGSRLKYLIGIFYMGIGLVFIGLNDDLGENEIYILASIAYVSFLLFTIVRWIFKQVKAILDLKNEKAKTELIHLQSQVNPHFFFNTLNNLYGLIGIDSKKAQNLVLKLSDMMRYSIYDGQKEFVSLMEEVEYLKNYIEIHKMRYHKKIDVTFNKDIEDDGFLVRPLMFIILLENAFKHGIENLRSDAYVHIDLISTGDDLYFEVENNFDKTEPVNDSGIGLKNLKRRLELVYLNKHELSYSTIDNVYKAKLKLTR